MCVGGRGRAWQSVGAGTQGQPRVGRTTYSPSTSICGAQGGSGSAPHSLRQLHAHAWLASYP